MQTMPIYPLMFSFVLSVVPKESGCAETILGVDTLTGNDLIAMAVSIAKHHGNLPDFLPG